MRRSLEVRSLEVFLLSVVKSDCYVCVSTGVQRFTTQRFLPRMSWFQGHASWGKSNNQQGCLSVSHIHPVTHLSPVLPIKIGPPLVIDTKISVGSRISCLHVKRSVVGSSGSSVSHFALTCKIAFVATTFGG